MGRKKLHVSLSQLCYIIPIINKLSNYFDIILYYVINEHYARSIINLIEVHKIGIDYEINTVTQKEFNELLTKSINTNEIFLITSWDNVVNKSLIYEKKYEPIYLNYSHGIDEEFIINGGKQAAISIVYDLYLNATLYDPLYKNMIYSIYNIDKNKKTIVFFETTSIWLFKKYSPIEEILVRYQQNIINNLIKLKDNYNIILRSHPQDYYGYISSGKFHVASEIENNFKIDYTPIPVFNFYDVADIIITSRFSASGYQALFIKSKQVILLESDFENRKKYTADYFINKHTTENINRLMTENKIISKNETYILSETKFEEIHDVLHSIDNNSNDDMMTQRDDFLIKTYGTKMENIDHWINNTYLDVYLHKYIITS